MTFRSKKSGGVLSVPNLTTFRERQIEGNEPNRRRRRFYAHLSRSLSPEPGTTRS